MKTRAPAQYYSRFHFVGLYRCRMVLEYTTSFLRLEIVHDVLATHSNRADHGYLQVRPALAPYVITI